LITKVFVLKVLTLLVLNAILWPCAVVFCEEGKAAFQSEVGEELRRSQYYLRLGTEDELQFYVHVWGQVRNPGLYLVADGTDVVGLISIAGGPSDGAKLKGTKLIRTAPGSEGIVRINLERFTKSGDYSEVPVLEPGDAIVVPSTVWHNIIRFGTVLSVAALFANVIVYATR
jgi:hypothetical protein